jgi:Ni,Fe-hydrogenase III large subunit/Ni,Fe-hydrogenase III component G
MSREPHAECHAPADLATAETRRSIDVGADQLATRTDELLARGFRLALVAAHEDADSFRIVYLFTAGPPDRRLELAVRTDKQTATVPSLAAVSFPASRFEREMHDLYGITPTDHPLPRRLVRHQHWPHSWHPARSDAGPPPPFNPAAEPYPFLRVQGPGVYEIPVGPIHAGLIEPGHFRFSVVGETILKLNARLWFTHKGIEKQAEGRTPLQALPLAERISGDTTVGHTLAYCLAVEDALAWPVPPEASLLRVVLLELERLYNHIGDIGALCNDVGYGIINAHALRIKERLLRLNAKVTGHRLLRDAVAPGGTKVLALPTPAQIRAIADDIAEVVDLALANSVVRDRFTGTAILPRQQAADLGALGYVGRASGIDHDARRDHPYHPATTHIPTVAAAADIDLTGDVLSRFQVRAAEVETSTRLLSVLLADARTGHWSCPPPTDMPPAGASGVGLVEGWRGTITHRLEIGTDGTLTRIKIVDPSFFNWPALPVALADTIVPDFPLTNKSFNLSYAGNDL